MRTILCPWRTGGTSTGDDRKDVASNRLARRCSRSRLSPYATDWTRPYSARRQNIERAHTWQFRGVLIGVRSVVGIRGHGYMLFATRALTRAAIKPGPMLAHAVVKAPSIVDAEKLAQPSRGNLRVASLWRWRYPELTPLYETLVAIHRLLILGLRVAVVREGGSTGLARAREDGHARPGYLACLCVCVSV